MKPNHLNTLNLDLIYHLKPIIKSMLNNPSLWNTVYIDYHPPRVFRLQSMIGKYRVYLHCIQKTEKPCLLHKHKWPSIMEKLKYGFANTYKHEMNERLLSLFSSMFNRNSSQTVFLFNLLDGDYSKLFDLELRIKNCHVCFCPGDMEDVEEVMAMVPKSEWFNSEEQAKYLTLFTKK